MANLISITSSKVLSRLDKVQAILNQVATQGEPAAARKASSTATAVTQATWKSKLSGRPVDRPGGPKRPTSKGSGVNNLTWEPAPDGGFRFGWDAANAAMPYLIIQEAGTGRSAVVRDPVYNTPSRKYTIPSQRGRFISPRLLWSDKLGGQPVGGGAAIGPKQNGQLYPASMLDETAVRNFRSSRKRIRREIRGKHAIQEGGEKGFLQYEGLIGIEWQKITQALRP